MTSQIHHIPTVWNPSYAADAMEKELGVPLERTLPLSGHFVEGRIEGEDRLALPPDALREVLLNAVMHRDYAQPGGHVAIAVFDDRMEIRTTAAGKRVLAEAGKEG